MPEHGTDSISAGEAARDLGVSRKALRQYEAQGLVSPPRTDAGWRIYTPAVMARLRQIVALRQLALGLGQIKALLDAPTRTRQAILEQHRRALQSTAAAHVRHAQAVAALMHEETPSDQAQQTHTPLASFELPWPWTPHQFDVPPLPPVSYLTGPLGSGKTRLAQAIARAVPHARFLGLERAEKGATGMAPVPDALLKDGASDSPALRILLEALEHHEGLLVVDLIEDGLNPACQSALARHLTRRSQRLPPVLAMTRSTAILDLDTASVETQVLFCPANHTPPFWVAALPGALGYDAMRSCLAAPETQARVGRLTAHRVG